MQSFTLPMLKTVVALALTTVMTSFSCAVFAQQAASATTDAAALSKARAIGTKNRSAKVYYTRTFDLSSLPLYQPQQQITGVIRQWGNNYLKDSGLMTVWEKEFRHFQPDATFADNLVSSAVAFPGLIAGTADLAPLGRQALWDELKGFEREGAKPDDTAGMEIIEIVMATGSYDVRGWTFALGALVHKDNPLAKLTMAQLDGIFGAERSGGWNGLDWDASVARGPDKNIRTWGQAGLTGEWANKPIHVYGFNFKYHFADEIDKKVLQGSGKWNEQLKTYSNMAGLKADGSLTPAGELMMNDLSKDPYGIAYAAIPFLTPTTKMLALAGNDGKYVALDIEHVQDRTYPLIRDVYYYIKRMKGQPVDPKVKEFLRYVLSREGQSAIQRDGKYLPLTATAAALQLQKLD